jgi:hypothetical protein
MIRPFVMPGLVPGIHALREDVRGGRVDGRDKPGHDDFYAAISAVGD